MFYSMFCTYVPQCEYVVMLYMLYMYNMCMLPVS